jgi:serine/threonine protein kinase
MALTIATRLGPYEILAPLGSGGMGEVWKARDTRLDRIVAIKTINGPFSERFEREARAISALNHPHICTLYDVGEHEGAGYLVMELVTVLRSRDRFRSSGRSRTPHRSAPRLKPHTRKGSSIAI